MKFTAESVSPCIKNFVITGEPIKNPAIKKTIGSMYNTAKIITIKQNKESRALEEASSRKNATSEITNKQNNTKYIGPFLII